MVSLRKLLMILVAVTGLEALNQCEFDSEWEDPYKEDQWEYYTKESVLSSNEIISLKADSKGNLWVGTYFDGLMKFDGQEWTHYGVNDGLPDFSVYSIEEGPNGNIWLGTWTGLSIFDGSQFSQISLGEDDITVYALHLADNGSMWVGTDAFGLYEISGQTIQRRSYRPASPWFNDILDITEDGEHVIWAGTRGGVIKISGNHTEYLGPSSGIVQGSIRAVAADSWGDVWFGIWGAEYAIRYERQTYTFNNISLYNAWTGTNIHDIMEDMAGNIWFVQRNAGAVRYNGSVMRTYLEMDGLPGNNLTCIEMDLEGNLWFGSEDNGLARYIPAEQ